MATIVFRLTNQLRDTNTHSFFDILPAGGGGKAWPVQRVLLRPGLYLAEKILVRVDDEFFVRLGMFST